MGATRILIVDDHPLFREALKQAIAGGVPNASVSQTGSLDAARALLDKDDNYDLVLLDLRMPGVQGLSGLIYMRAQYPNIPVVIITAADDQGLVQKALNLNASGFIPKTSGIETYFLSAAGSSDSPRIGRRSLRISHTRSGAPVFPSFRATA